MTAVAVPRFVRGAAPGAAGRPQLDAAQRRVADHPRGAGPLVVLGAPGTGRTTALVEALVTRVERDGADPSSLLVLAPSRRAAASLRDRASERLGRTTTEALARTPHSYAWSLLQRAAAVSGGAVPRLLSGPEQDQVLAELLRGHEAGDGAVPDWPAGITPAVRAVPEFRAELRDLLMRALERGLGPTDLAGLGRRWRRPEWVAGAQVLAEYLQVTALATPGAHDPAAIVHDAAAALRADPALLAAERARLSLVVVDDHHESTAATAELLDLVAGGGVDLLLAGDPDATTTGFRGGDPALLAAAADRFRGPGGAAPVVVLPTRWRSARAVAEASARVAARTGSVGAVAHRGAEPPPEAQDGAVQAHLVATTAQQWALVAALLREEHVRRGTPWSQVAVLVRTTSGTGGLRRALSAVGVPVVVPPAEVPVRTEPAVVPLLVAMRLVLAAADAPPPGVDDVLALLVPPLGGADPLALRRLRQVLLAAERSAERADPPPGGEAVVRSSDELLVDVVLHPERWPDLPARAARPALAVASVLAAGRAAARAGGSAEEVLWALWSATGLAERWRRRALAPPSSSSAPGSEAVRALADRDLDAVVALFDAASRYEEREPGSPPQRFLEHLEAQDVPADSLAARAVGTGAVELLTPAAAAGREWDVVVVTGLQEGAWPDVRLRGSLLGAPELVDVLAGRTSADDALAPAAAAAAARRQVLDDEQRLLHVAVSRARRRLVVTAVRGEDERPSAFVDLVCPPDPHPVRRWSGPSPRCRGPWRCRRWWPSCAQVLLTADGARDATGAVVDAGRRAGATAALARLAAAGVPGADPDDWYGLPPVSDDAPAARSPTSRCRSARRRVEAFSRCGLRWLLEGSGGRPVDSVQPGRRQPRAPHRPGAARGRGRPDGRAPRPALARARPPADLGGAAASGAERSGWSATWPTTSATRAPPGGPWPGSRWRSTPPSAGRWSGVASTGWSATPTGALHVVDLKTGTRQPKTGDLAEHAPARRVPGGGRLRRPSATASAAAAPRSCSSGAPARRRGCSSSHPSPTTPTRPGRTTCCAHRRGDGRRALRRRRERPLHALPGAHQLPAAARGRRCVR